MKEKSPLVAIGLVVGWGILVILGVRLAEGSVTLWQDHLTKLHQSQQLLSRLQGWIQVQKEVSARREEVLGPLAHSSDSDLSWKSFQGLQQVAKEQGVVVTELRPSSLTHGNGQKLLRLDTTLEGGLKEIATLLQRIPSVMPGVHLENLQFVPKQGEERIQALVQLSLPELEVSR